MPAIPRATPARMTIPGATIPSVRHAPTSQPYRTMEPRARSDENAPCKPVGSIVAIGCASVGIISVVAIRTGWSRSDRYADGTDSNSDAYLRLRVRQWDHQHRQQRNISHIPHTHLQPRPDSFWDPETASDDDDDLLWVPFWLLPLAIVSTYLNAKGGKKFRTLEWPISTILLEFSHLARTVGEQKPQDFQ